MKRLMIGIWNSEIQDVQTRPTDQRYSAEQAAFQLSRQACRELMPDVVLIVEDNRVEYSYELDQQYTQADYAALMADLYNDWRENPMSV